MLYVYQPDKFQETYEEIYVLKLLILIVQRLALHQNRVEFRQQFIGAIIISLTALHNIVRCHGTLFRHTETQAAMGQNEL